MDVACAHGAIQIANSELDVVQTNAENEFKNLVQQTEKIPKSCGTTIELWQLVKRRNYEGEPETFYRSSIFIT